MIRIFTFASHRLDFIEYQLQSLRKNLLDEFELVVFNNAKYDNAADRTPLYDQIGATCARLGLRCIDVQKDDRLIGQCQAYEKTGPLFNGQGLYSNANVSHAYALSWAWGHISKERQPVAIFDSDVFLVESVSLEQAMANWDICRIADGRPRPGKEDIHYMWPTFVLLNMANLPVPESMFWYCGQIDGVPVDVGGQTHHYFEAHPELRVQNMSYEHFGEKCGRCPVEPADFDEFYLPQTVFHYRSGSNWNHRTSDYHARKTQWLKERIGG